MNPKLPRLVVALIILLPGCFATIGAQTAATKPAPSPTASPAPVAAVSPPPEQKAYDEARRIKDPEKKIEALEKLVKDFPDRFQAFQARNEILDTLIRNFPTQTERIKAAAERYLAPLPGVELIVRTNNNTVAAK